MGAVGCRQVNSGGTYSLKSISYLLQNILKIINMEEPFGQLSFTRNSRSSSSSGSVSPSGSDTSDFYQARQPYRMASSFELGDEQPQVFRQRAKKLSASSYQNLFGASTERSRPCVKRVARSERDVTVRRNNKPLPVNTLTGAILGVPEQMIPQALSVPHHQYRVRRSPGGAHSQLW